MLASFARIVSNDPNAKKDDAMRRLIDTRKNAYGDVESASGNIWNAEQGIL
ncbi:MAG: hypothetical protein ACRED0_11685 [Gammaproteobacteria bacterium]